MTRGSNIWLHRFALFVAASTFILVSAGASVTSTGSGLAVPDWPLSFGTLFPEMKGGVVFEHGHRMIAGVVLVFTIVLVMWLYRKEERPWVKKLGLIALVALFAQALLGGLTVLFKLPTLVSVSHAGLAQAFFCAIVSIALFTSPGWNDIDRAEVSPTERSIRGLALATTVLIYLQIMIGAFMRHTGAGLAIPDFPLAYGRLFPPYMSAPIAIHFAHRVGAFVVTVFVLLLIIQVARHYRRDRGIFRPGMMLAGTLILQILLGGLTIWTRRAVIPTTAHVAVGAAVLAISLIVTLRSYRFVRVMAGTPRRIDESMRSPEPARAQSPRTQTTP